MRKLLFSIVLALHVLIPQSVHALGIIYDDALWTCNGSSCTLKYGMSITGSTLTWGQIVGTPTTLAGYGITDGLKIDFSNVTGTLGINHGGTGQTTANTALNALLPSQTSNSTKFLQTDGTNTSWQLTSTFNSSSPPAIGNTTPNTGTFTVLNAISMTFGGSALIDMQHLHVSSQAGLKKVEFGADKLAVYDLSGNTYFIQQIPVIVQNGAVNGVNGLDTGSLTANTWYYLHCIYNPTTKLAAGLLSLSKTSPTLPSGYTAFRWISTFRTDAASNFLYQHQTDKEVYYLIDDAGVNRILSGGTATTMTAFSLNTLLPVDAEEVFLNIIGTASATATGSNANINISPVVYPANVATPLLTTGYGVLQIVSTFTSLSIVVEQRSWWRMRLGPGNENGSSPPTQGMAYKVSNSTGGATLAYIDVMGYYLPL